MKKLAVRRSRLVVGLVAGALLALGGVAGFAAQSGDDVPAAICRYNCN
jgi:hypothetical protein